MPDYNSIAVRKATATKTTEQSSPLSDCPFPQKDTSSAYCLLQTFERITPSRHIKFLVFHGVEGMACRNTEPRGPFAYPVSERVHELMVLHSARRNVRSSFRHEEGGEFFGP